MSRKVLSKNPAWKELVVASTAKLQEAVERLNSQASKIVLIVEGGAGLVGTVSDGDIRRGLLKGVTLDDPITQVMREEPICVSRQETDIEIIRLMNNFDISHVPIVGENKRLLGLFVFEALAPKIEHDVQFVVMAGGRGVRMGEQTNNCPKPMLKVAGRPMLEHIVLQARSQGFSRLTFCVGYLQNIIEDYFGNGDWLDIEISYVCEDEPLGTAGALSLLDNPRAQPIVVSNGDVISDVNYSELLSFHNTHNAYATMAVRLHEWKNPFGVVHINDLMIERIDEKPISQAYVNAGVYVLSHSAVQQIPKNTFFDMPQFFNEIAAKKTKTMAYPLYETWMDVAKPEDLAKATRLLSS